MKHEGFEHVHSLTQEISLAEARTAIPRITKLLEQGNNLLESLQEKEQLLIYKSPKETSREELSIIRSEIERIRDEFNTCYQKILALRGIVKNWVWGEVDFLSRRKGKLVYLCYQLGEETISYYHEIGHGSKQRKKIDFE